MHVTASQPLARCGRVLCIQNGDTYIRTCACVALRSLAEKKDAGAPPICWSVRLANKMWPHVCFVVMARTHACEGRLSRYLKVPLLLVIDVAAAVSCRVPTSHHDLMLIILFQVTRATTSPEYPERRGNDPPMTSSLVSNPHPSLGVPDRAATRGHAADAVVCCRGSSCARGEEVVVGGGCMQNPGSCPARSDSYRG